MGGCVTSVELDAFALSCSNRLEIDDLRHVDNMTGEEDMTIGAQRLDMRLIG